MAKEDPHRDWCRRMHRMVGQYLAVFAWRSGLDCVALNRYQLEGFFDLERFKSSRIQWLKKDLRPWFPHVELCYTSKGISLGLAQAFLSRLELSDYLPKWPSSVEERIEHLKEGAPRTALFAYRGSTLTVPSAEEIISYLARLSAGVAVPFGFSATQEDLLKRVENIKLSRDTVKELRGAGIQTVADLISTGERGLSELDGVSYETIEQVGQALEACGLLLPRAPKDIPRGCQFRVALARLQEIPADALQE